MKSSLIDLTLAKHHETKLAILVSETGDASKAVWLPLSVVEIEETKKYATGETRTGQKTNISPRRGDDAGTDGDSEGVGVMTKHPVDRPVRDHPTYDYRAVICRNCGWTGRRSLRTNWPACPQCHKGGTVESWPEKEK